MAACPAFLSSTLATLSSHPRRPHVTLTFAQSIDAKIAGAHGQQLILSGKQSMLMTHWMRTMHDAILVGIGTALNDDPQLNTRLLNQPTHRPRPVILDPQLRFSTDRKLLKNYCAGTGRRPWVITSSQGYSKSDRVKALEEAGARVFEADMPVKDSTSIDALLVKLHDLGVRSLMVEGGARIINSFFQSGRVDVLIVTTAPTMVGQDGIGYDLNPSQSGLNLKHVSTQTVGIDTVMVMKTSES